MILDGNEPNKNYEEVDLTTLIGILHSSCKKTAGITLVPGTEKKQSTSVIFFCNNLIYHIRISLVLVMRK